MKNKENYIGFLKYKGESVNDGFMDARKSAQALIGLDEAIRFFAIQQSPELKNIDFEFPVEVRKGSWEIAIPNLETLFAYSGGIVATAYMAGAANTMAKNDFDNIGLKDIFLKSLEAILWTIRTGKHLGGLSIKKFTDVRFQDGNELIGICNSRGERLYIPRDFFKWYIDTDPKLLENISKPIENDITLSVGVYKEDGQLIEETITKENKDAFVQDKNEEKDEGALFPELQHDQTVTLEGVTTRGNEKSNTMGFDYKGHVLTCMPESGSIVQFKASLFLKCRIHGTITRLGDDGFVSSKKPKIIFTSIEPLEDDQQELSLFD